jgi:hypothetical protein
VKFFSFNLLNCRKNKMCKYLKLNILFLFLFTNIYAQEFRLTDNKGTLKTVRNTRVTSNSSAPTDPIEGDIWFDTASSATKIYDGTNFIIIAINNTSPSVYTGSFIITAPNGSNNILSSTFDQTITNIPFLPSQITFVAHTNIEAFPTSGDNQDGNNSNTIQNTAGSMNGFVRNDGTASFLQQVIFIAAHGNSINDISRYASNQHCLGLRYTNQNGDNLGIINATLASFDTNNTSFGFTLNVKYSRGDFSLGNNFTDIFDENLIVFYTAHR